jgi:hypothetical protein
VARFVAALAIFGGWLSIPIGAVAGLIVSEFFGIGHVEGVRPPMDVYGISGIMVFWIYACVTIVTALPLIAAMVASDPRRPLQIMAAAMLVLGVAMLPSELGRAFGLPIVAGAASMWIGADLVHRSGDPTRSFEPVAATAAGAAPLDESSGSRAAGGDAAAGGSAPATVQSAVTAVDAASEPASAAPARSASATVPPLRPGSTGNRRSRGGRRATAAMRTCPWCSTVVPAADQDCPNCGAALAVPAAEEVAIPGVTEVPPELRRYAADARSGRRPNILKMIFSDTQIPPAINTQPPSDAEALRPPSDALRAEMARLDAEIAAGGAPTGARLAAEPPAAEPPAAQPVPPDPQPGT